MDTRTLKSSDLADYVGNNLAENQGLFDIGMLRGSMIDLTGICYLNLDTQICKLDTGTPKPSDLADHLGNNLAENQGLFDIGFLRGSMIVLAGNYYRNLENQGLFDIGMLGGSMIVLTGIHYQSLDTQICKMETGTPKTSDLVDYLGSNQGLSDIGSMIVEVDNNWSGNYKAEFDSYKSHNSQVVHIEKPGNRVNQQLIPSVAPHHNFAGNHLH